MLLWKMFIDLCLLRANPQDLPTSTPLTVLAVGAYWLTDVIGVLDTLSWSSAVIAAVTDTLLLVVATTMALRLRQSENRLPQTLSALAGSGAMLSALAWLATSLSRGTIPPEWVWLPFLVWYTVVFGHVLRHALTISFAAGVAIGFLYLILSIGVTGALVGPVSSEV